MYNQNQKDIYSSGIGLEGGPSKTQSELLDLLNSFKEENFRFREHNLSLYRIGDNLKQMPSGDGDICGEKQIEPKSIMECLWSEISIFRNNNSGLAANINHLHSVIGTTV